MKLSYIDWIWRVKGRLTIQPNCSAAQAFDRLGDLFEEKNTTCRVEGDTLVFTKKNALPQDKMSVFDRGTLQVSHGVLCYSMTSRALLACFLAPLFFYALGYTGVAVDKWRNPPELAKAKAEAAKKRSLVKPEDVPMNPVDTFLHAPTPEKKKDGEEIGKRNRKPSMTTAYTYMGIFFALWVAGRILEHKLIHARFRKRLAGDDAIEANASMHERGFAADNSVRNAR
ncbi:hypothetical protein WBP07_28740 [Novosphingobium sp. BL-8A]|uniref:hypothetical protein n=1 Tax=Novosphingobium sp. BL-8A TaxID=3127639 RepID=UPI003758172F